MSINWNHLVFCYDKSTTSLCVAVTQHAKRCTATTRLYFAPLPNVWQNTSICLGSVNLPKTEDIDEIAKAYINSTKTHLNHTGMFRDSQVSNTES
ncbi:hypothetical protein, partial [Vibrio sp. 10N.222.49.C9]|uniref:hypothetical protein n=1 Tax=Vibrio sp. 10N.222.49.C9 TaxID=3229615 RepID=UPI0035513D60